MLTVQRPLLRRHRPHPVAPVAACVWSLRPPTPWQCALQGAQRRASGGGSSHAAPRPSSPRGEPTLPVNEVSAAHEALLTALTPQHRGLMHTCPSPAAADPSAHFAAVARLLLDLAARDPLPTSDVMMVFLYLSLFDEVYPRTLRQLMSALQRHDAVPSMLDVYRHMYREHPTRLMTTHHVNRVIAALLKHHRLEEALAVLADMEEQQGTMAPNTETFNMLVHHSILADHKDTAKTLLTRMEQLGLKQDKFLFSSLLSAQTDGAGGGLDALHDALAHVRSSGRATVADATPFNQLLHKFCAAGSAVGAMQTLEAMLVQGIAPDSVTLRTVMQGMLRLGAANDGREGADTSTLATVSAFPEVMSLLEQAAHGPLPNLFVQADKVLQWASKADNGVPYHVTLRFFHALLDAGVFRASGAHPALGPSVSANAVLHPRAFCVNVTGVRMTTVGLYLHTFLADLVLAAASAPTLDAPEPVHLAWRDAATGALRAKDLHLYTGHQKSKTSQFVQQWLTTNLSPPLASGDPRTFRTLVIPGPAVCKWVQSLPDTEFTVTPPWTVK